MKARELSQLLAEVADRVARELLPNGSKEGHEWRCGSIDGEAGKSLGVHLSGSKAGVWSDFSAGTSGDLLDLWMAVRGCALPEAMDQASKFIGVQVSKPERKTYPKPRRPEGLTAKSENVTNWLRGDRKLSPESIAAYKVVGTSGGDYVVFPHLRDGELCNYKMRNIKNKKDMRVAGGCEQMLWGWQAIPNNARSVVICEGELDAISLHQYGYPALSVFSGAGNHAWLDNEYPNLERFDDIYLCLDNDDAGKAGCNTLIERLGRDRCLVVTLPKKDANECLMTGVEKSEMDAAFSSAQTLAPHNLRNASSFTNDVLHLFYPSNGDIAGVMLPWPKVMRLVHIRQSEMSIWTGISGHGKSQLLGQLMLSAADQGERICIASLEMKPGRTIQRMIRQALGTAQPSHADIKNAMAWMDSRFWFYDFVGEVETDKLMEIFAYARKRYGCSQFVIDNLMMLDASEEDLDKQSKTVKKLMAFKAEHNCHIHLVAHARKGQDESKAPRKMDVKGSGNIVNQSDNVFSVWRNKPKEECECPSDSDPDAILYIDKQRNGEWEGVLPLWYDRASLNYRDSPQSGVRRMTFEQVDNKTKSTGEMVEMVDF
jgi:twinkle protein